VSFKAGLKKIRAYQKKTKRMINDMEDDTLDLPSLPPSCPEDLWTTSVKV
jgi:hypothetical protein